MASGAVMFLPLHGNLNNQHQQNPQVGPMEKLRKVETKALGVVQIMIGLMHVGFGVVLLCIANYLSISTLVHYPIWGGLFFIISGSLSVATEKHLTVCLVKSSAGMNILSALTALTGIVLYVLELVSWHDPYLFGHSHGYPHDYQQMFDYYRQSSDYASYRAKPHENLLQHKKKDWQTLINRAVYRNVRIQLIGTGLCVLLLLFTILEFCIAVSTAHFGCKATCCNNELPSVVFLPYPASGADVAPPIVYPPPPPPAYEFVDPYAKGQ